MATVHDVPPPEAAEPPTRDLTTAELVARRVLDVVGRQAGLSASIGIAVSAPGEIDALALMTRADVSLLEAKRQGKRTYRLAA